MAEYADIVCDSLKIVEIDLMFLLLHNDMFKYLILSCSMYRSHEKYIKAQGSLSENKTILKRRERSLVWKKTLLVSSWVQVIAYLTQFSVTVLCHRESLDHFSWLDNRVTLCQILHTFF